MAIRQSDLLGPRSARRRRASGALWWQIVLLSIAGVITGAVIYSVTMFGVAVGQISDPLPPEVPPEVRPAPVQLEQHQRINILVMGLDADNLRSDVMMLVAVDPEAKKIGVLQIPRDTRALIAGKGDFDKINAAYAYGVGDKQFPANLRALKTVEDLLGVSIHYTVVVKLDGFRRIIDSIGGVMVDIPRKMDYDDPDQDLHIHFQPGPQKLMGRQALEFVRWRHNNDGSGYPDGDLGRIRTQQQFLASVLEQMLKPANLISLPKQVAAVSRYIDSTMEVSRLVSLTGLAAGMSKQDVEFATLPGTDAYILEPSQSTRLSYFIPDPDATGELVDRLIRGIDRREAARTRIELVSAPGQASRAARLTQQLTAQGFVVTNGPAPTETPAKTRIIDLAGTQAKSQLVARALASRGIQVELVGLPGETTNFDVRVELGQDILTK